MPVLKNPRHERFAQEIAKGQTITKAYTTAGFKDNDGNASKLASKVRPRIKELTGAAAKKAEVTIDRVMAELAKIGFSNMQDYQAVLNGEGVGGISRDHAAAVQEMVVDTYMEGTGEGAERIKRVRFKLGDKRAALVDMGKHLGMFSESRLGTDGLTLEDLIGMSYEAGKKAKPD